MEANNKMPGNNLEYPESDISDNQQQQSNQEQQSQSDQLLNDDEGKAKGNPASIKDLPEIKPARPGIM